MAERKIRNLNPEEIECRVGTVMEQGITLLLYKVSGTLLFAGIKIKYIDVKEKLQS